MPATDRTTTEPPARSPRLRAARPHHAPAPRLRLRAERAARFTCRVQRALVQERAGRRPGARSGGPMAEGSRASPATSCGWMARRACSWTRAAAPSSASARPRRIEDLDVIAIRTSTSTTSPILSPCSKRAHFADRSRRSRSVGRAPGRFPLDGGVSSAASSTRSAAPYRY